MQYTSNYNLMLPEGTDTVNLLTQMNPNTSDIDAAMFANKQASIGTATEIASGTVHAITRANPDSNYFRFTATSNWTSGDTMNVDGNAVSVFLTDGTLPGTGAYIINSEVFGILTGSRVTLFLTNPVTTLSADNVSFDPTGTTLDPADTDVDKAIKSLSGRIQRLWVNPNPASNFVAQSITLSSNEYDLLVWLFASSSGDVVSNTVIVPKGVGTINSSYTSVTGTVPITRVRTITRVSDTSYTAAGGFYQFANAALGSDDYAMIPVAVYGIKI